MKSISASIIFILIIQFGYSQGQTIKFLDNNMSPKASLNEVSWIQGYWKGEAFGGTTEEFWSPPLGDSMMFSFKLVVDNKVIFYELGGIRQVDDTLLLQLKHFGNDFKGWEEKDETVNFVGWSGLRLNTEYNMNGYRLIKQYWGKGYATESGKASVEYAFNIMKLPEIFATTELGNQASHNALLKIGLQYVEDFYFEQEQVNLRWYKIESHNW